ncbi:MAG: bifunctional adenosylcobinamide kinase/adenosylcobinamide-phosphate guanylyltransferase [Porphyromonadaceae bacterium]|nr:bifunctional adenosylcobinamide kinase/adenosylcobinamide-phosphate guanylyltransferase [Porphyromonadaceae bacterium]
MSYIYLITGGERSGKSAHAERLALGLCSRPVYLATARIWDEEFRERVCRHQSLRSSCWDNIEEEKYLSLHPLAGRTVLVDCVTLWATNFFFDLDNDVDAALEAMKSELAKMLELPSVHWIFVTNEIGLGGVSVDPIQRKFTSLQGWINQHIAALADEVTLMVSGIPVKIK